VTITSRLRHEFLTPLTVILNAAEILTRYAPQLQPAEISETAARVQKHGKALYRLIHKMLLYSQLEAVMANPAKVQQAREHITPDAQLLTSSVARQIAQQAQRADDLRLQVSELPPLQIAPEHYRDLLTELLENAFKYSKAGSVVQVQSRLEADRCVLSISDQGRGLAAAQLEQVRAYAQFERPQYEQQGAGLGLAIVKRLSDIYAGQFELSSQPGQGTLACVKFVSKV
jgi:two-component system sensor histidine kinase/response regulator